MNKDLIATLQNLISDLNEGIVIFDSKGIIQHGSLGLKKLLGKEQIDGDPIYNYVDKKHEEIELFLANMSPDKFMDIQVNILRRNGHFPARMRLVAWYVQEGVYVALGSIIDSSAIERKKRDLLRKTLTIEHLSRSQKIRTGKLNDAIYEILDMSSRAMNTTRINAWLFNTDHTKIECIGNFDQRVHSMVAQESLPVINMPKYFDLFASNKIIVLTNAQKSIETAELLDDYLIPNGIVGLMDIPLRIEGEIIGVICFEEIDQERIWTLNDQKFGLIAAQMVSLAIDTHRRKIAQQRLEAALHLQKKLMRETNHRVKNNLTITISLMRMQLAKCRDDYHRNLMNDSINRIQSIAALHELLEHNTNSDRIQFRAYANNIISWLKDSLVEAENQIQLLHEIEECEISSSVAITLGLLLNEGITNSIKHAFPSERIGTIRIDFYLDGANGVLEMTDNGIGFDQKGVLESNGFDIMKGLVLHIQGDFQIDASSGTRIKIVFRMR